MSVNSAVLNRPMEKEDIEFYIMAGNVEMVKEFIENPFNIVNIELIAYTKMQLRQIEQDIEEIKDNDDDHQDVIRLRDSILEIYNLLFARYSETRLIRKKYNNTQRELYSRRSVVGPVAGPNIFGESNVEGVPEEFRDPFGPPNPNNLHQGPINSKRKSRKSKKSRKSRKSRR